MAAPNGKGSTPVRSLRIDDDPWVPARAIAALKGETLKDVVVRALERYVRNGEYLLLEANNDEGDQS